MYKGTEAKLFDNDKVEQAEADGWFDNPGDAQKPTDNTSAALEAAKREEAEKAAASSAATTLQV